MAPLVLCYHAVSADWPASLSVTPDALERQLHLLAGRGHRGATFEQVAAGSVDGRAVAVTFDDAYLSVLELAKPILEAAGFPGTVFVPTDYPDQPERPMAWDGIDQWLAGPHEPDLRPMAWDQIGRLADAGWEIGSHTCSHPRLTTVPDDALARELRESRARLEERLGRPCTTLAYPYGDHDARVVAAAGAAGYAAAGTLPGRLTRPEPLAWPRVGIYHVDDERRFRLKVSTPMRLLRRLPVWPK